MYVHVDNQIFDKRPFLGVLLGLGSLVLWIVVYAFMIREYRGYGKTPEIVDLKSIAPPPETRGRWVKITQPLILDCSVHAQEVRTPPESWLFGKVESTFFTASVVDSSRNMLIVYDGDISCKSVLNQPFVGVLEELNSRRRSYLSSNGFVFPPGTDLQFSLGDGPARSRKLMLMGSFLPLCSIFIIARYWPRWRAKVREAESPFSAPAASH